MDLEAGTRSVNRSAEVINGEGMDDGAASSTDKAAGYEEGRSEVSEALWTLTDTPETKNRPRQLFGNC